MAEIGLSELDSIIFDLMEKSTDNYIYVCNMETNISKWSKNAVEDFGLPGEYMYDVPSIWGKFIHQDDRHIFFESLEPIMTGERDVHCCEYRALKRDGVYVWLRCKGYVKRDENNIPKWFAGTMFNLGAKNKIDITTNLLSMYEFQKDLEYITSGAVSKAILMFLDIDNFKILNDRYSFTFGDEVLRALSVNLRETFDSSVRIYRLSGDKFAFILYDGTRAEAEQYYKTVQSIASDTNSIKDKPISFTMSAGACMYPEDGVSGDELYKNLDYALSKSKQEGKNRLTFFSKELLEKYLFAINMLEALKHSINDGFNGFELYYQPLFDNKNNTLIGCEALLRWHNEEFPYAKPVDFIPLLEDGGYIVDVGMWVIAEAVEQVKKWQKIMPEFKMNVNASYLQFKDNNFKNKVIEVLKKYDISPNTLVIELTESCKIIDSKELSSELRYFRENGVLIALDDFGTGYASISMLRELTTDWVKIDHSFVSKIMNNDNDRLIIKYIISLCSALNITVCVEGIENEEIYNVVKEYSPDVLQGYYYSVPIPKQEFEDKFFA